MKTAEARLAMKNLGDAFHGLIWVGARLESKDNDFGDWGRHDGEAEGCCRL